MASKEEIKSTYNKVVGFIITLFLLSALATIYSKGVFLIKGGIIVVVVLLLATIYAISLSDKLKKDKN